MLHVIVFVLFVLVKQDVKTLDDEGIRVKEQAILEIGNLFAETKQATGNTRVEWTITALSTAMLSSRQYC